MHGPRQNLGRFSRLNDAFEQLAEAGKSWVVIMHDERKSKQPSNDDASCETVSLTAWVRWSTFSVAAMEATSQLCESLVFFRSPLKYLFPPASHSVWGKCPVLYPSARSFGSASMIWLVAFRQK